MRAVSERPGSSLGRGTTAAGPCLDSGVPADVEAPGQRALLGGVHLRDARARAQRASDAAGWLRKAETLMQRDKRVQGRALASLMPWSFSSVAAFSHSGASDLQWPARRVRPQRPAHAPRRGENAPGSAATSAHRAARTAPRRVELHRLARAAGAGAARQASVHRAARGDATAAACSVRQRSGAGRAR